MILSAEYHQFSAFLELIDNMSAEHRTESVTFRDSAGKPLGLLTLDDGMVRFGVEVQGRLYIDEIASSEAPRHVEALQKIHGRITLTRLEKDLLAEISSQYRAALCGLTARALRRMASLWGQSSGKGRRPDIGLPQLRMLNLSFTTNELHLAAGRRGGLRHDDAAVGLFSSPPAHADECWLFEWQLEKQARPWPVQTNQLAKRRLSEMAAFGNLGQQLSKHLTAGPHPSDRSLRQMRLILFEDTFCFFVSTARYLTLFCFQQAHLGRILKLLERLLAEGESRPSLAPRPAPRAAPLSQPTARPLPALPAKAEPAHSPVSAAPPGSNDRTAPSKNDVAAGPTVPLPVVIELLVDDAAWIDAASQLIDGGDWADAAPPQPDSAQPDSAQPDSAQPAPSPLPLSSAEVLTADAAAEVATTAPAPVETPPPAVVEPAVSVAALPPLDAPPEAPRFSAPLLKLRKFTASVDGRVILKALDLELGRRGVYALMGPGGSGKSSLSGILSGRNRAASGWAFSGEILYDGATLGAALRPPLIGQKLQRSSLPLRAYLLADLDDGIAASWSDAQLEELLARAGLSRLRSALAIRLSDPLLGLSVSEWWRLAIARELVGEPSMLCIDEPTAAMEELDAAPILELLRAEGAKRAVLLVTHNQQHARQCSDYVLLLAAGELQEYRPTAEFFGNPVSRTAKDYVRTGGCSLPAPEAEAALAAPAPPAEPAEVPSKPAASQPHAVSAAPIWPCEAPCLSLRGVTLTVGSRKILSALSFDVAAAGCHLIVSDDGASRRFLSRLLCGPRPANFQIDGVLRYEGRELRSGDSPATLQMSAQLLMLKVGDFLLSGLRSRSSLSLAQQQQQVRELASQANIPELLDRLDTEVIHVEVTERRALEILRAALSSPSLLVIDDPLAGLPPASRPVLLSLLARQAAQRALLITAEDPAPYAALTPAVAWMCNGCLSADRPPEQAETSPAQPDSGRQVTPSPTLIQQQQQQYPEMGRGQGPRGFQWLRRGSLAGMPAPGVTTELAYDLELMRSAGVQVVVTLTAEPLPSAQLSAHGLQGLFFPIEDMGAPSEAAALALAVQVQALLAKGLAVVFHCKAGQGRTGTMLAAQLIYEGIDSAAALAQVRAVDPGWVQSETQVRFLHSYAGNLRRTRSESLSSQDAIPSAIGESGAVLPDPMNPGKPPKEN